MDPSPTEVPRSSSARPAGTVILDEVRELYEREKRKSSVILRGLNSSSQEEVLTSFSQICQYLNLVGLVVVVAPAVLREEFCHDDTDLPSPETGPLLPYHQGCVIVCVGVQCVCSGAHPRHVESCRLLRGVSRGDRVCGCCICFCVRSSGGSGG